MLKASVGEGLLEGDALDEHGVCDGSALDLLDADQIQIQIRTQGENRVHNLGSEEVLVGTDQLAVESSASDLLEHVSLQLGIVLDTNGNVVQNLEGLVEGLAIATNDHLGGHALVDELSGVLEQLSSQQHNSGGSITNLVILRLGNVHQSLCSGMHNVQQLHNLGAIVRDCRCFAIVNEFVHTTRTQSSTNGVCYGLAGVDVAEDLSTTLARVCTIL